MLDGKTVFVTGAAGALGREVVLKVNALNARLILVDRVTAAAAFPGLAGDAPPLMLESDVSDELEMGRLVDRAVKHCGAIDGALHLAGGFPMGEAVSELSRETWDAMMTLNAWSFIALSRAVVPHMRGRGGAIDDAAQPAVRLARLGAQHIDRRATRHSIRQQRLVALHNPPVLLGPQERRGY